MNVVRPTARSVVEGGARGEPRCSCAAHMGRRGAGGVRARKNAKRKNAAERSGVQCVCGGRVEGRRRGVGRSVCVRR